MKMRKCCFLLLVLLPCLSFASIEHSAQSTVSKIYSYSTYGSGDVVVQLASNGASCNGGYWLKKADPGFQANFSMLMAAYHAGSKGQTP